MAKKPEPPQELTAWSVFKNAKKQRGTGIVEAPDEAAAKGLRRNSRCLATKLMAIRR
jgi:hypothetical protein